MNRSEQVRALHRSRPKSRFLRIAAAVFVALAVYAWLGGTVEAGELFTQRRADNLWRFLSRDALPKESRDAAAAVDGIAAKAWATLTSLAAWALHGSQGRNMHAAGATLALAVLASVLAAAVGLALAPWTARTISAAQEPFESGGRRDIRRGGAAARIRSAAGSIARLICVLMRAIPEYILAFLLGATLPSPAWAAALALVIHNGGILGRLFGETFENLDQRPARAWYAAGSPRLTTAIGAQFPAAMPRLLTYFFTRFESCVRESTILGMLGFVSLGHWIVQERAAGHYDEMLLLVMMGAFIVIIGDFVSWIARTIVRRAA